jgi:KAP family P-loop domain
VTFEATSSFDPSAAVEEEALRAFERYANRSSQGLATAIRRAVHYAKIDDSAHQIVIDKRAFFFGLISSGLQDDPSKSFGNTATWIANWIAKRAGTGFASSVRRAVTGTDELLKARRSGMAVVASRSMEAIAASAAKYAVETVNRNRADLRHFFAAFVDSPSESLGDIGEVGWTPTAADIQALRREVYDRIATNPERGEKLHVWQTILRVAEPPPEESEREPPPEESERTPPQRPVSEVSGFTSDRVDTSARDGDPLEVIADIRAFARLICLKEAEPPLSIGLFGGWGSGKSTFMQLLEREIDALTSRVREAAKAPAAPKPNVAFVGNVVQVRFNAWHFADANLWASLTAEFFDQLRAGGYARSGKAIHTRLVERVNAHVHALTSDAIDARQALAASEATLRTKQKERDRAVADVQSASGPALNQKVVDAVTKAFEAHKADLLEMGRRTYHDNPVKDITDFVDLAKTLQTAGGQLVALAKFVFARGWRAALAVSGLAAVVTGLWLMWPRDLTSGAFRLDALNIFALLAGLGALARAVLPGIKIIGSLIESTSSFAANLEGALEEKIKKVAPAEESLQRAAAETEARRAAAERASKALARYVDPNSTVANPPRLLRFMLEDDPDTRALEKEIGLISRVRRLFQAVDEIVREERDKADKAADAPGPKRDPDVPDRIVIYIDDLDRCTPPQVYAVLQAIHLLLAFKLFVVVVGVDVGWVQEVLANELRPKFAIAPSPDGRKQIDIDERKLAVRYLEKIFQLPFWLRRLSFEGEDGGSYARFVRALLAQNLADPAGRSDGSTDRRDDAGPAADAERHAGPHTPDAPPEGTPAAKADRAQHGADGNSDAPLAEVIETVRLTKSEVDCLASKAIGNLSGREPRAVKRFTNIYRIIRAGLSARDRSLFLGEGHGRPDFPVVAILIALETGQPLEVADAFYAEIAAGEGRIGTDIDPSIAAALEAAQGVRGAAITTHDCIYWARVVRRYSFNKYI